MTPGQITVHSIVPLGGLAFGLVAIWFGVYAMDERRKRKRSYREARGTLTERDRRDIEREQERARRKSHRASAFHPDTRVDPHVGCVRCGRDRSGLGPEKACPECSKVPPRVRI